MVLFQHKRLVGILFLFLILSPYFLLFPSIATPSSSYQNYDTITTSGVINIYYSNASAFQYVMEKWNEPDSTFRIVVGAGFYYHTNAPTIIKVQAMDDSSDVVASSSNISLVDSGGVKNEYIHYFLNDPYLTTRGAHYIRLVGVSATPTAIHYTTSENGSSYYSNETTGMDNWFLDNKQYFIRFIEEDIVNITSTENKTGRIDFLGLRDVVDAYLLDLPAHPVKIILEVDTIGKNLNLELYNYTNDGDMVLQNPTVMSSTGYSNPKILTYVPPSSGYHVLLVKANTYATDITNYTVRWFNSSNEIIISRPVINYDTSLDISGVYASLDGYFYNGSSYQPEKAEYFIYRDDGTLTGKSGLLYDLDTNGEWTNLNIDVSDLNPGAYYVTVRFEDNAGYASAYSPESARFFILGNLTVGPATVTYIGNMDQKLNISGITVDNTTALDVFTYTIFDSTLQANTSLSGPLTFASGTQTWYANNIDVSGLADGSYFVLGYFEDHSENKIGIGNASLPLLNLFTVVQFIEVKQVYINYTNQWAQSLDIGGLAETSYNGHGTSVPIRGNEAIVTYRVYHNVTGGTSITGNLSWNGDSWNASTLADRLIEGPHFVRVTFTNDSQYYSATGSLDSSIFWVTHVINITSTSQTYIGNATQIVTVEITANSSYYGNGVGTPIEQFPDAQILCTVVDANTEQLTTVSGLATWRAVHGSWIADISTASLPADTYYVTVNFSIISNLYNASDIQNTTSFTVKHILTLIVPTPIFNPDTATLDIVAVNAISSYSLYGHINASTALSTYFEIFNYTSKASIGIYGGLSYNETYADWRNTSIDLSKYAEGQFFVHINITSIDIPEGAATNSSPFDLIHKIVITGIDLDYSAGYNQTLNITVAYAASTYFYHTEENITHANYRFHYRNNQSIVLNPNLNGNLTKVGSVWQAFVNVSKLMAGEYYVMINFADPTAANAKGSKDTTNFTVVHTLNTSTPLINYIDNMEQNLNISILVNSTYYYHRIFNSSGFGSGLYRIHLADGTPTSLTGNLMWNGTAWVVLNADVSLLPVGTYQIACTFSTSYTLSSSAFSAPFSVIHAINITKPNVTFNNISKQLTILHAVAQSSYYTHGILTNLTALTASFEIFRINNQTTGLTGQLTWNGTEWQVLNLKMPNLPAGQFYIQLYFNDSQVLLAEQSSNIFTVAYPEQKIDWVVVFVIILIILAVAIVLFWSLFPEKTKSRSDLS